MRKQSGFTSIELIIAILVVAIIGGAGWMVYRNNHPAAKSLNTSSSNSLPTASDVSSTPKIQSTSDLDNALNILNQNDPSTANSSDSSQLTSQSSF